MFTFQPKQFESINGVSGLSEKMMRAHYTLYEGYIKKANEIQEKLKAVDVTTANATQSELRSLKLGFSFAVNGIKNHELYFENLSGSGKPPTGDLGALIESQFGSYDAWKAEIKATGIAARGWVWLAYDRDTKQIFNYLGDTQDTYPIWNATPIIALDVYEHAYAMDYGVSRGEYIDVFFKNLNWEPAERLFNSIK